MFPHSITVWNQIASNHTGGFTYNKVFIDNVRYELTIAKQNTKEGETNTSLLNLFVFPDKIDTYSVYIEPKEYELLEDKKGYYTFDTDTYIGLGKIDTPIPSGNSYSVDSVKPVHAMGNEIHHFEISGS